MITFVKGNIFDSPGPGEPYLWENEKVQILNFPTKRHWKDDSRLDDIEAGLRYLAAHYQEMGIYTLALPDRMRATSAAERVIGAV